MKAAQTAQIREIIGDREIDFLLHFTQTANLFGIVRHGLLSRRDLASTTHPAYASDHHRLDGDDAAISVSISRVNEAMFAAKRHRSGHAAWAILVLPVSILWTHACRFCWRNAATNEIRNHRGFRGGPWALSQMFVGDDETRTGLKRSWPTDPEAEVQVLEPIDPGQILGAVVGRSTDAEPVRAMLNSLPGQGRQVVVQHFGSD